MKTAHILYLLLIAFLQASGSEPQGDMRPTTLHQALNDLDQRVEKAEIVKIKEGAPCFLTSDKSVGMQLRNAWGLGSESPLRSYFAERGIRHAEWAYMAICEAWVERLRSGSFDEERVIRKFAEIEAIWREDGKRLVEEYYKANPTQKPHATDQ